MVRAARLLPTLAVITLLLTLAIQPSHAQQLNDIRQTLAARSDSLNEIDNDLAKQPLTDKLAGQIRSQVERTLGDLDGVKDDIRRLLAPVRTQLAAMGPAPEEGQPAETGQVARERDRLNERAAELEGLLRQAETIKAHGEVVLRQLSLERSATVAAELLQRGPSPLSLEVWRKGLQEASAIASELAHRPILWWQAARPAVVGWKPYLTVALALIITLALGALIRHRLKARYGQRSDIETPSYPRAVMAAAIVGLTDSLIPAASAYVLLLLLHQTGLVPDESAPLARGIAMAIIFYSIVGQCARAVLAPQKPQWAIVPLDADRARKAGLHTKFLVAWLSLGTAIWIATEPFRPASAEVSMLFALLGNGITACFMLPFLGNWLWKQDKPSESDDGESPATSQLPLLRLFIILAVAAIPLSALLGYANLSYQVASGVALTAILIGGLLLARTMSNAFVNAIFAPAGNGGWISNQLEITENGSQSIGFWFGLLIDFGLLLLGLPLLLLVWGVPETVIAYGAAEFMQGFTVGGMTFQPVSFFWAVVIFALALIAFRFLRKLLNQRVLSRTRLDVGARHSISAALGYVGFFIALMLAVATMGLDLSNIAIIAGALSVGIGFGLQNVVNNFVSGLLLLIERPIKVGDWIVVGGYEGTVKRISVRSTELETFDRAEVIVPNSELVSAPVVNWTHKTRIVRVTIPVGVAYGSDTRLVEKLLLDCAKDHPDVLSYPAPFVVFMAFGDSSLDFQLRVYARDTNYFMTVTSDLHFAIDKAFRENNVEIPFPQRDLHVKNPERVVEILRNGTKKQSEIPPQGSDD